VGSGIAVQRSCVLRVHFTDKRHILLRGYRIAKLRHIYSLPFFKDYTIWANACPLKVYHLYVIMNLVFYRGVSSVLQTKRLFLRNLCHRDTDILFDYRNDSRCNLYQRYEDTDKAYLQHFVETYSHSMFLSTEVEQHYAIVYAETSQMIGDLSIFFSKNDNCFTMGITIAPDFQSQGYGYELLQAVVSALRNHYPTVDLVALIEKGNAKSIALFRKLNFIEECYAESIASFVYVLYGNA
jgi:RimJ/RimL family protein N-acetyltransferase